MDVPIITSETDRKNYKVLTLDNSLQVLLIYEEGFISKTFKGGDNKKRIKKVRRTGPESSTSCRKPSASNAEKINRDSFVDKILRSGFNKKPLYHWSMDFEENLDGSKRKKLNDDNDDNDDENGGEDGVTACVCLSIGVGSLSEPENIPGLAHLLEHMVFKGTKKFPGSNAFRSFLARHGGSSNANTDYEKTHFYFDVDSNYICHALEMFSNFFINPIMSQDSIQEEVEIVDHEFRMVQNHDPTRMEQMLLNLAKKNHPMHKFMWGNKESLVENPARDGVDVFQELHRFRQRYYVAQNMCLVVYTGDPNPVEKCIRKLFSKVPHSNEMRQDFGHLGNAFDTTDFNKLYKIVPVISSLQLEITWALPSVLKLYRNRPLQYLERVIGDCGVGSLFSSLKRRDYVRSMTCGNTESGQDMNSSTSMFRILLELTEDGLLNYKPVVTTIFQFLKILRNVGAQVYLWREKNIIEMNDFKHGEQIEIQELCNTISSSMIDRDIKHVIVTNFATLEFDGKSIADCLTLMTANKMNLVLRSKAFQGVNNLTERWFGTSYSVEEIDADCMALWTNPPDVGQEELNLPPPNDFLTTDFSLKPAEPKYCELDENLPLRKNKMGRIFFKSNDEFKSPKAFFHFYIWSKNINRTPTESCMTDIFAHFLSDSLKEETCPADLAHLSHSMETFNNGFYLKFSGFSQNLQALIALYIERICSMTLKGEMDYSRFKSIKESIVEQYTNLMLDPQEYNAQSYMSYMLMHSWSSAEKLTALDHVTMEMLISYVGNIFTGVQLDVLIMGNVISYEALAISDHLISKLKLCPMDECPKACITDVKEGVTYIISTNANVHDNSCVISNCYILGRPTIRGRLMIEMLLALMEEPLFDELRVKRMLGYSVSCVLNNTYGVYGFSVTVCSQSEKFSMEALDNHIDDSLEIFHNKMMRMTEKEFKLALAHMANARDGVDSSLESQAARFFDEILSHDYMFTRNERELVQLTTLTLKDLKRFWNQYMPLDKCKRKKLSFQIIGNPKN